MAVRNLSKGHAAKQKILESTGQKSESIEVWELDLQSIGSVKAFATKANQLKRLDGVLENAGMVTEEFKVIEGFETTILVNVVSTALLALLLIPKLKESGAKFNVQPRLSIVSSDTHFIAEFLEANSENVFERLNVVKSGAWSFERYSVSKLLEVFFVRELGSILSEEGTKTSPVIVNCLTPGLCKSNFGRDAPLLQKFTMGILISLFGRSTEAGSRTLVSAISAGQESNGCYMEDCLVGSASPYVLSDEGQKMQKKIWRELSESLEKIEPEIMKNVTL